eukprot:jgi/Ulvmu1/9854/UM057_0008.1
MTASSPMQTPSAEDKATKPTFSVDETINPCLEQAEYAVRGAITVRAAEIERELKSGTHNYSFDKVLFCNIGNPQALDQKPITFPRRLIACCECPELAAKGVFPEDVVARSQEVLAAMKVGAYTVSTGHPYIRNLVAKGISARDGHEASPESIFLSDGASAGVHALLSTMIKDDSDAFLVPIPQYPLYSAALTLYGGTLIPYYLDESCNWGIDVARVEAAIAGARTRGMRVRGMVVINPGNPTGQVLSLENQVRLVQVCAAAGVPIIADEVYQENVWAEGKKFTSFRKVALDNPQPAPPVVLSLHSTSKGFLGECGHRGGYLEVLNCPAAILTQLKKLLSINLCCNTIGQVMVGTMMRPPAPGDASHEEYEGEKREILASLKRRAAKVVSGLRELQGVTCCDSEGALYAFPRLDIPAAAQHAAREAGVAPDFFYCLSLLNATGIVAVPGSGFKQVEGTFHMRLTILPQEADIDAVLSRLSAFHSTFMDQYRASGDSS